MKIECDELLVICDNCGHAIHVKELDNNLIKLNNKNDKLISIQDAIDALIEWYGCEPNDMDYFKEILAKKSSAQPVDKDINVPINDTISRQAAIDAVETIGFDFSDSGLSAAEIEEVCEAIGEVRQEWSRRIKRLPSAQQWIPVSERLPEENTPVLLGVKFNDDFKYFVTARMDYNYWQGLGRNIRGEIRWMPLPEPYKEDKG